MFYVLAGVLIILSGLGVLSWKNRKSIETLIARSEGSSVDGGVVEVKRDINLEHMNENDLQAESLNMADEVRRIIEEKEAHRIKVLGVKESEKTDENSSERSLMENEDDYDSAF